MDPAVEQMIARARENFARSAYLAALEDLQAAAERHPGFADVQNLMGLCLSLAGRPEEALAAFERFSPRFVLLDLGMPGMNGLEVARRLRERANGHAVTLVALTGWGQADDRERTRAAGFDHHLVKPVDMAVLQALLGQFLTP